jgi:DNA replication protein DnaC
MINHTLEQMTDLHLNGMKNALLEQMEQTHLYTEMPFEERFSILVDNEVSERKNRRIKYMLKNARLKYKNANINDIDYHSKRGLDKKLILSLSNNDWLDNSHNIIITGPTGTGKTWLANALANHAVISGYSAHYIRISTLIEELSLKRAEGDYLKWLKKIQKFQLLILDDLGLMALSTEQTQELLEVIESRSTIGSIIVTSQLPIKEWYAYFKNPTLADAIMDRLIHNAYKINLKGESMRKVKNSIVISKN